MLSELFTNLVLSIIIGATIGLERESTQKGHSDIGGIRTYAILALCGSLAGILYINNYIPFAIIIAAGLFLLVVSYYTIGSYTSKSFGLTSELSAIVTFLIGLLLVLNIIPLQTTVAIFVILMFILSVKSQTTQLVAGVSSQELQSFISYAIIALVVMPVLPDKAYKLNDIPLLADMLQSAKVDLGQFSTLDLINPRKIWLVVVLITGIDVFGYILGRFVGDKSSFALTSFIAGFVSSTSATQSLAQRSKNTSFVNHLVGAAILANLASFIQIFLLVGPLNPKWLVSIVPSILLMIVTAGIITFLFLRKKEPGDEKSGDEKKPTKIFSLLPALKFAGILIVVKIVTKICLILFGKSGFIISSVIASFAGIDAIMVNLADMAGNSITYKFAFLTFILVNATNLLSKSMYSYLQGNRNFAVKFAVSAFAIICVSATWLIFI
ncbi:MAG: DUF4010 domain-containing protein [Bacteroidales bacterium]